MGRVRPDHAALVRAHARLTPVAFVPEVLLYQADDPIPLWEFNEKQEQAEQPPPFYVFAWAGGQGLARHVLDHPGLVAGKRVLDLASGSGLVAVAAARAGAAHVRAVDVDPVALTAMALNAEANGVTVHGELADILDDGAGGAEVVLAGDVFYSKAMTDRVLVFLQRAAADGARVLVGDPGRAFLPREHLTAVATMDIPVTEELESTTVKRTTVWQLRQEGTDT